MLTSTTLGRITRFDLARTIAGRGRYWTTAYYIDGLLIDSGGAHTAEEFVAHMSEKRVSQILNTHSHEDHIGANHLFQHKHPELEIRAHPLALAVLRDPRGRQPLHAYRRVLWGWPSPSEATPINDEDTVSTERYEFQAIHTPGHSPDHMCFYEPNHGWMFTGDLFIGGRDRALREDYHIWEIIASLKKISALPISELYPGSARITQGPQRCIQEKIEYLQSTGQRVLALHRDGWNERSIARKLFGGLMPVEWMTLGHFSRINLVRSYLRGAPDG